MMASATGQRRGFVLKSLLLLLLLAALALLLLTCWRIERESRAETPQPASAIVVFGAAEYAGRPSPVYRARLDHAYDLYQRGLAPLVITTGGAGGDAKYSEGGVGRDYLLRRGIRESALIAETQGDDTARSAQRVAKILQTNGLKDCIAVSDSYHMFRIERMLAKEGISARPAPRPNSRPKTAPQRAWAVLREAGSYFLWRLNLT